MTDIDFHVCRTNVVDLDNPITEHKEFEFPLPDGSTSIEIVVGYRNKNVWQVWIGGLGYDDEVELNNKDDVIEFFEELISKCQRELDYIRAGEYGE